jgi:ubiquitin C-terminal hydrolase
MFQIVQDEKCKCGLTRERTSSSSCVQVSVPDYRVLRAITGNRETEVQRINLKDLLYNSQFTITVPEDYRCGQCQLLGTTSHHPQIDTTRSMPQTMLVLIKRYVWCHPQNPFMLKVQEIKIIPDNYIQFGPSGKQITYKFTSVVCHDGTSNFGHYVAYVKTDGSVVLCNDRTLQKSDLDNDFVENNSYIFLYDKVSQSEKV